MRNAVIDDFTKAVENLHPVNIFGLNEIFLFNSAVKDMKKIFLTTWNLADPEERKYVAIKS